MKIICEEHDEGFVVFESHGLATCPICEELGRLEEELDEAKNRIKELEKENEELEKQLSEG